MALKIPMKRLVPVAGKKPAPEPVNGEKKYRTSSYRLDDKHHEYIKEIQQALDCDRSEALRRSIRMFRIALSGHEAMLLIKARNGTETRLPVVVNGIPT